MAVIVRYPTEFGSHVKLCFPLGLGAFWYWFFSKRQRITLRLLYAMSRPSVVCLSVVCLFVCL